MPRASRCNASSNGLHVGSVKSANGPEIRKRNKERDQRSKMRNAADSRRPAGVACCPLEAQRMHAAALTTGNKGPSQG